LVITLKGCTFAVLLNRVGLCPLTILRRKDMALIGTIRNNFWFVLILLGLALAAFILMDISSAGNRGGVQNLTMGDINGTSIDYGEFQQTESTYYSGNSSEAFAKKKTIWDFYVEKALIESEADALGINVSKDELMDLQFGDNLSPIVTQNWTNPQTRQVDRTQLNQFRTAIEEDQEMNPQFRAYWAEQEKHIIKRRAVDKLTAMVTKGMFTPNWLAEAIHKEDNTTVDFELVKVPFDKMDVDVEVSDSDISAFLADNKAKYYNEEESRILEYAVFDVLPTAEDSTKIFSEVDVIAKNFRTTENDSTFALSKNGGYANFYFGEDQLPDVARERIKTMNIGEVYGPYGDQGNYSVVKLIDKKSVPDTVTARHILKNCDRTNATELATAMAFIDSLKNELNRGNSFADLAREHSDDTGSAAKGGDLGDFVQGAMVPEFNEVCFYENGTGYQTAVSQFGVHLIDVQNRVFGDNPTKYKIASIVKPIIPSENTQKGMYVMVADYVSEYRTIDKIKEAIGSAATFETSPSISSNDYVLGTLGQGQTSRDIIKWAFDGSTEVGDVSPEVYTYSDQVNYYDNKYVVATLKSVETPGMMSVSAARPVVEDAVRNQLKAKEYIKSMSVSDLNTFAAQNELEVKTIEAANVKVGFLTGIGQEPEVVATAMGTSVQAVSKPIIGNSGVFVVKPLSKNEPSGAANLSLIRSSQARSVTSQANTRLLEALKKNAKIEDARSKFF